MLRNSVWQEAVCWHIIIIVFWPPSLGKRTSWVLGHIDSATFPNTAFILLATLCLYVVFAQQIKGFVDCCSVLLILFQDYSVMFVSQPLHIPSRHLLDCSDLVLFWVVCMKKVKWCLCIPSVGARNLNNVNKIHNVKLNFAWFFFIFEHNCEEQMTVIPWCFHVLELTGAEE